MYLNDGDKEPDFIIQVCVTPVGHLQQLRSLLRWWQLVAQSGHRAGLSKGQMFSDRPCSTAILDCEGEFDYG